MLGEVVLLKSPDGFNHAKVYIYSPGYSPGRPGEETKEEYANTLR